jgi:UTP--glucose-1-phosphate uridylyltransferase
MGAAIEVFDKATTIEVTRARFVPVKTTNDLLVLRSDCYDVEDDYSLRLVPDKVPFVDLDPRYYKVMAEFEARFPQGPPSLREASALVVNGDWTFGPDVRVVGEASLDDQGTPGQVEAGTTIG